MKIIYLYGYLGLLSANEVNGDNMSKNYLRGKIIAGFETKAKPWMVLLEHYSGFCGGTLYTKQAVITAAHCTMGRTSEWKAHANRFKRKGGPHEKNASSHQVIHRINHPKYIEGEFKYDVSIWFLNNNSQGRTEVYLDNGIQLLEKKRYLKVIGWGNVARTDEDGNAVDGMVTSAADTLQETEIPLRDNSFCAERYASDFNSSIMICTGFEYSKSGTCQGDSGGPVFRENGNIITLIGLISNGIGCAYKNYYNMETKISNPEISAFILATIFPSGSSYIEVLPVIYNQRATNSLGISKYQANKLASNYEPRKPAKNIYFGSYQQYLQKTASRIPSLTSSYYNPKQVNLYKSQASFQSKPSNSNYNKPYQVSSSNIQGQSQYPGYLASYTPRY